MRIIINGKDTAARDGVTVAEMLSGLGVDYKKVAVEFNLRVLVRSEYETLALKEGDRMEIIIPVGGGGI